MSEADSLRAEPDAAETLGAEVARRVVAACLESDERTDTATGATSPAAHDAPGIERLRAFALSVAASVLPHELVQRVGPAEAAQLSALCCSPACADNEEALANALASAFVTFLLQPPGDATPKLHGETPDDVARNVAAMYWRCLVHVALMPTPALESLARHHKDLQSGHLAVSESSDASSRRRRLVEAILPRFSMACTTREEEALAAKRRVEIEEMKKRVAAEASAARDVSDSVADTDVGKDATDGPATNGGDAGSGAKSKVVARVTCGSVTLRLTLEAKHLAKPLSEGCIAPFLNVFNKKLASATPLTPDDLERVEIDGVRASSIDALGHELLLHGTPKVELFPRSATHTTDSPGNSAPGADGVLL
jgi:hypothetical protein